MKERGVGIVFEAAGPPGEGRICRLSGALTRDHIQQVRKRIAGEKGKESMTLDLSDVTRFDSFGAMFLIEQSRSAAGGVSFRGAPDDLRIFVDRLSAYTIPAALSRPHISLLERLGEWVLMARQGVRNFLGLALEFIYWIAIAPLQGRRLELQRTCRELIAVGVDAIPIVFLISILLGTILALNAAMQLEKFGASIFVADLVGVALTRELGPVFTAIIVAGRTGSAIAAELGTMVVTEEIDALRVMGINPRSYLIVPKILALVLALPCLVVMADVLGIMGGMLISTGVLDIALADYYHQTIRALFASDIITGLIKSAVFGFIIGLTGSVYGLSLKGGAEEVGRITTATVVVSFLLIIIADTLFTIGFTSMGA